MSPYRPYPHIVVEKHWKAPGWFSVVLVGLVCISAGWSEGRLAPLPVRELGRGWTQDIERNAMGETDLVIRGPHGRVVFRAREDPPPTSGSVTFTRQ